MIEKFLLKLAKKEKLIALAVAYALGALTTALGVNIEVVMTELCSKANL